MNTYIHGSGSTPAAQKANNDRIVKEAKEGGRTYPVGTPINVRLNDGEPTPSVVEAMETGGMYGNVVACMIGGERRRISVQRVSRRKVAD